MLDVVFDPSPPKSLFFWGGCASGQRIAKKSMTNLAANLITRWSLQHPAARASCTLDKARASCSQGFLQAGLPSWHFHRLPGSSHHKAEHYMTRVKSAWRCLKPSFFEYLAPSAAKYREKGWAASKTGEGPSANPFWNF